MHSCVNAREWLVPLVTIYIPVQLIMILIERDNILDAIVDCVFLVTGDRRRRAADLKYLVPVARAGGVLRGGLGVRRNAIDMDVERVSFV